jgi:hypothetical protein
MESKEFWDQLLKEANKYLPKEYQLIMEEVSGIYTELPDDCEARTFKTVWKDGNTYGKGLFYTQEQIMNMLSIENEAYHLANSMIQCFEQIENG